MNIYMNFRWLGAIIIPLFLWGSYVSPGDMGKPSAQERMNFLFQELNSFTPLPGAIKVDQYWQYSGKKQVGASFIYKTDKGYDEIRKYYMEVAKTNGWRYLEERNDLYPRQAEKDLFFYSENYTIVIKYLGPTENYQFSVSLLSKI